MSAPVVRASPIESARFGLRIVRAEASTMDVDALIATLRRDRTDVAILRAPAPALALVDTLRRRGLAPIVADTIVHYDIGLPAPPIARDDSVTLLNAVSADADLLGSLARETFAGYVTHYHANPLFASEKILAGYAEWAAGHVQAHRAGAGAWLVEADGELAGFSCYREDPSSGLAIGVLNGIIPSMRGRGIYRRMLQQMLSRFADSGNRRFAIATQVQNVAVQRIWASRGLALRRAENTVHINVLFDRSAERHDDLEAAVSQVGRPTR